MKKNESNPLCVACAKAVPTLCWYIKSEHPEEALAAMGAVAKVQKASPCRSSAHYEVIECPEFIAGELPALGGINEPIEKISTYQKGRVGE